MVVVKEDTVPVLAALLENPNQEISEMVRRQEEKGGRKQKEKREKKEQVSDALLFLLSSIGGPCVRDDCIRKPSRQKLEYDYLPSSFCFLLCYFLSFVFIYIFLLSSVLFHLIILIYLFTLSFLFYFMLF